MAEKIIEEALVGKQLDNLIQNIVLNGDRYVVTRRGEPIAVVVPSALYERWQHDHDIAFGRVHKSQRKPSLVPIEVE